MEKIVERNILFDYYGELLTDRQKEIYQDAVYQDMSLAELSDNYGISRQGVHDFLKRCDKILIGYEKKLKLIEKSGNIKVACDKIKNFSEVIEQDKIRENINTCLDDIWDNL